MRWLEKWLNKNTQMRDCLRWLEQNITPFNGGFFMGDESHGILKKHEKTTNKNPTSKKKRASQVGTGYVQFGTDYRPHAGEEPMRRLYTLED